METRSIDESRLKSPESQTCCTEEAKLEIIQRIVEGTSSVKDEHTRSGIPKDTIKSWVTKYKNRKFIGSVGRPGSLDQKSLKVVNTWLSQNDGILTRDPEELKKVLNAEYFESLCRRDPSFASIGPTKILSKSSLHRYLKRFGLLREQEDVSPNQQAETKAAALTFITGIDTEPMPLDEKDFSGIKLTSGQKAWIAQQILSGEASASTLAKRYHKTTKAFSIYARKAKARKLSGSEGRPKKLDSRSINTVKKWVLENTGSDGCDLSELQKIIKQEYLQSLLRRNPKEYQQMSEEERSKGLSRSSLHRYVKKFILPEEDNAGRLPRGAPALFSPTSPAGATASNSGSISLPVSAPSSGLAAASITIANIGVITEQLPKPISDDQAGDIERVFEFVQSTGISGLTARAAARKMVLELNVGTVRRLQNRYRKGSLVQSLEDAGLTDEDIEDVANALQEGSFGKR